jgi:hypothetical protein
MGACNSNTHQPDIPIIDSPRPFSPKKISIMTNDVFTTAIACRRLSPISLIAKKTPLSPKSQPHSAPVSPKSVVGSVRKSPLQGGRFLTDYKKVSDLRDDDIVIVLKPRG